MDRFANELFKYQLPIPSILYLYIMHIRKHFPAVHCNYDWLYSIIIYIV